VYAHGTSRPAPRVEQTTNKTTHHFFNAPKKIEKPLLAQEYYTLVASYKDGTAHADSWDDIYAAPGDGYPVDDEA
jgi:hypothetical protein